MKKIMVNEREITTNFGENGMFKVVVGNDLPNYTLKVVGAGETDQQFLERLVECGYTRIRFAQIATRVRGYSKTIAYCRK